MNSLDGSCTERIPCGREIHRFKVGDFECVAICDGTLEQPARALFPAMPKEQIERVLDQHGLRPDGKIVRWFICLAVNLGLHQVLVDTGLGSDGLPSGGRLLQNLLVAGIVPQEVDTVILTHAHVDHIGGCSDGDGRVTFANARHVMWQDEWDYWTSEVDPAEAPDASLIRRKLWSVKDQLDLINREGEVVPGIRAMPAAGHTPGHLALLVSSGSDELLYISDAMWHPIQMEYPEHFSGQVPVEAEATGRRLLERAADDRVLVLGFHFPFPGLGYVVGKADAWQWQPL